MNEITKLFDAALCDGRYDDKKLSWEKSEAQIAPCNVVEGTLFGGQYEMQADKKGGAK